MLTWNTPTHNTTVTSGFSSYVATATMPKAGSFEGHPFTVEVGLSFGGDKCREGITVHRFANRIPLLFEGGSDVATKVANTDVKWNNYKLKSKVVRNFSLFCPI